MTAIHYRTAEVDGLGIFYREAGPVDAPTLLLLPGFPSAGLADRFHLVAADLPGFGQSDMPSRCASASCGYGSIFEGGRRCH
jgi:pimeloyl-ACP methyl ester carboxylesterase